MADNHFRQQRQVQRAAGRGESGGHRRMRVQHGTDVRPHLVNLHVHGDLGRTLFAAAQLLTQHVDDDEIVDMHHTLAHARWSGEDALGIQTNAAVVQAHTDVAVVGGHPTLLVHKLSDIDNILPVLLLRLRHRGKNDCNRRRVAPCRDRSRDAFRRFEATDPC